MSPCPWQPLHGWDTTNRPELAAGTPLCSSSLDAIGTLLITAIIHVSAERSRVQRRRASAVRCNTLLSGVLRGAERLLLQLQHFILGEFYEYTAVRSGAVHDGEQAEDRADRLLLPSVRQLLQSKRRSGARR